MSIIDVVRVRMSDECALTQGELCRLQGFLQGVVNSLERGDAVLAGACLVALTRTVASRTGIGWKEDHYGETPLMTDFFGDHLKPATKPRKPKR